MAIEKAEQMIGWDKELFNGAFIIGFDAGYKAGSDSVVFPPHSNYRDKLREMICEGDFDFTKIFEEIEYEGETYTDISNEGADALADYFIGLMEQIDERRSEEAGYSWFGKSEYNCPHCGDACGLIIK